MVPSEAYVSNWRILGSLSDRSYVQPHSTCVLKWTVRSSLKRKLVIRAIGLYLAPSMRLESSLLDFRGGSDHARQKSQTTRGFDLGLVMVPAQPPKRRRYSCGFRLG